MSTERSPRVRSSRPIALSLPANFSTAAGRHADAALGQRRRHLGRAPRRRRTCCMTCTSTGRKRKYFRDFGSLTMKLCSPR